MFFLFTKKKHYKNEILCGLKVDRNMFMQAVTYFCHKESN